jgi:3-deoxy-7-phosphoheptulonate synthase
MIVVLRRDATKSQIEHILETAQGWGLRATVSRRKERTVIGVVGEASALANRPMDLLPGVESVMRVEKPYKLASREFHPDPSRIALRPIRKGDAPVVFGGRELVVIAGPCSVETEELMMQTARAIKTSGARMMRAGAFKPRTSPYSFQGLGVEGLRILSDVRRETGLQVITEVMDTRDVEMVAEVTDVIQIGARNMQNFNLLKAVGRTQTAVMIKRALSATIEEWLMSAEYVMSQGNHRVILCERGIRTFERATRNTLDLNAVPVIKKLSHLPIAVDPSHGTGYADLVIPMARAAVAAGCDAIMVEVHPNPREATSDGAQTLDLPAFARMMKQLRQIARALGRRL